MAILKEMQKGGINTTILQYNKNKKYLNVNKNKEIIK